VTIPERRELHGHGRAEGKKRHRDKINTRINPNPYEIQHTLAASDFPDFNDPTMLAKGPGAMVDFADQLIGIFQSQDSTSLRTEPTR